MIQRKLRFAIARAAATLAHSARSLADQARAALQPATDHLTPAQRDEQRRKQRLRLIISGALACGAVTAFGVAPLAPDAAQLPTQLVSEPLALGEVQAAESDPRQQVYTFEERIRSGDSLATLFARLGVADAAAEQFIRADRTARALYQLRPGRVVRAETDGYGNLRRLLYVHSPVAADSARHEYDRSGALEIVRAGAGFRAQPVALENERRLEMRSGEITNSLYGATDAAGMPDEIANQIAEIFAGDIDFYRDLRRGDQFRVIYEMFYQAGEATRAGRVLAVEFINNGKPHQAVWFEAAGQSGGYYGFQGQSLKRAFLRSPLEFTRISSGFGGRMHPIAQVWRAHTGVDYAAPTGTPVRSTADGVIEFAGRQNGYGNAVIVRHGGVNSTLYGHLSRFAPAARPGARVAQGEVIGYVGMTGWATGPHLHYEFRVNNRPQNPLTVVLPRAIPLGQEHLPDFRTRTAGLNRQLELLRAFQAARRERGA